MNDEEAISGDADALSAPPPDVVLRERVELLRAQLPFVLLGNVVVSSIVAWILREHLPTLFLAGWVAVIATVALLRWLGDVVLSKRDSPQRVRLRLGLFSLGSLVSGMAWGSTAFWMLGLDDPFYMSMIVLVVAGMVAGAVPVLSVHAVVYACYALPTLIPVSLVFLSGGGVPVPGVGVFLMLFLAVNLGYSWVLHRNYGETIQRRYENLRLVDRLREQMRIAREADIAKSRFLAAASHDLRQPLHAMGLFMDALQATLDGERQKYLMHRVRQSEAALQGLFNALLDISRLDAGAVDVARQPVEVAGLLKDLRGEFAPQAREKGLRLEMATEDVWVETDPVLLARILRNLISNAIRYTTEGMVGVEVLREGDRVSLIVSDTGPGIAREDWQRIFEEFQQLANPGRSRSQGLGLGLAIVRRLCDLLDHPLDIESTLGRGSRFRLSLPVAEPGLGEEVDVDSLMLEWSGKVLVIDDEPDVLEAVTGILREWGMEVECSQDEDGAMRLIEDGYRPDLLITDYRLKSGPVGLELIRWARSRLGERLGVLLITGDIAAEELVRMRDQGVPVLNKPVSARELRRAILREVEDGWHAV